MEHTKEPWRIGKPPPNGEQTIGDSKGLMVAVTTVGGGVSSEANARRIVACVNACAGIPTDGLEKTRLEKDVLLEIYNLRKQRDELLTALEPFGAIDLVESRLPAEFAMLVLRARTAISNAKGQP